MEAIIIFSNNERINEIKSSSKVVKLNEEPIDIDIK
jgi:hypothetical protein